MSTVVLQSIPYIIGPPAGLDAFAAAEDWIQAAADPASPPLRIAAAAVGLCAKGLAKTSLAACKYNMLAFGGAVYSELRQRGASAQEIADAASPCYAILRDLVVPTEAEVKAKEDFSAAGEHPTSGLSGSP